MELNCVPFSNSKMKHKIKRCHVWLDKGQEKKKDESPPDCGSAIGVSIQFEPRHECLLFEYAKTKTQISCMQILKFNLKFHASSHLL